MRRPPKISIITINFNNIHGLTKTMESVLGQTSGDYEYIIVDGGSTDGSVQHIARYTGKLAKWVSEKDNGIYDAMNKGIDMATGTHVYFLNAGDRLYDTRVIGDVITAIHDHHFPDIIFGDVVLTKENSGKESIQSRKGCDVTDLFYKPLNHQTIFASRDVLKAKFRTGLKMLADYDWFLSQLTRKDVRIHYMDRIICRYDMHGFSATNKVQLAAELKAVRETYFRKGFVYLLSRIKGTRLMYLLKVKGLRKIANTYLLKASIGRDSVANV